MNKPSSIKSYFKEADSWARDRQEELRASRRIAWIVAGAAVTVAVCEALALVFLMPLKTVIPYTLMVDRHTGYVQALKPLDTQLIAPDAALTRSFLVQYVIAREGFDINSVQSDYRKVALWSAEDARGDYLSSMQVTNPDSPVVRYPRSSVVDVRVKSVNTIGNSVSLVRYDTQRRDAGDRLGPIRSWAVVIRYAYTTEPMSTEDRMIDPLGFKVLRYRRSIETLPPPDTTGTPTSPPIVAIPSQQGQQPTLGYTNTVPVTPGPGATAPTPPMQNHPFQQQRPQARSGRPAVQL